MLPSRQALENTAVSFPPREFAGPGPMLWDIYRGPILPPMGTKERDRILRIFDTHEYNGLWQGARSGIIKKLSNVQFDLKGPPATVQYYQDILGYAHFGHGWEYLLKLILRDFLSQSYGAIFEIAGPGEPDTMLIEAATGINHLDSGRCYVTGNPIFPLLYYSLWDGRLHKMHASRVYMMVDDPLPDERYFGIGTCALERAIAISQRQVRMGEYIDAMLDDKPQPGILSLTGVSDQSFKLKLQEYMLAQQNDERPVFGRTMVLTSLDPNAPVKAEVIPFSQTPEKFDFIKYNDLDVSAMALALGVDRQELWELAGRGLGSGSQAAVLSMKSRAKLYGDVLTGLERFMNWAFLPEECEFSFVEHDDVARSSQASIDVQLATIAQTLSTVPGVSPLEIKKLLASRSDTFKDAFTNELGQITLPNIDPTTTAQAVQPDASLASNTPVAALPASTPQSQGGLPPVSRVVAAQSKAYSATSADFRASFADIVGRAVNGTLRRYQAENLLLGLLQSSGTKAYSDGLAEGGVTDALDEEDQQTVQNFVSDQIDYLDPLLDAAFSGTLPANEAGTRADMWSNKSLTQMLSAGRLSADKNGMYAFVGTDGKENCPTCKRLKGQQHRFKDWDNKKLIPGRDTDNYDCGGWQCRHRLRKTSGAAVGDW